MRKECGVQFGNASIMVSLKPHLTSLLKSLPPSPVDQLKLDELVKKTVLQSKNGFSPENRKLQWEYLLKDDIFQLAVRRYCSYSDL